MYDLIIIGAGPAGLSAALYAGRFRINTLIFEKVAAGGQILSTPTLENYPGFPGGISSVELADRLKRQTEDLGIIIQDKEVLGIEGALTKKPAIFKVKTEEETYEAKSIILATGAQPKRLGVVGEERLLGRGISYCATCDGPLFKNKEIAVIGGGDRAIEEAIFLSSYAKTINIIHRRAEFRASRILQEKVEENPKIKFILETIVEEISGHDKVEAVEIKNVKTQSKSRLRCDGVFIFVGIKPNTAFLKNFLETNEAGFIMTDQEMKTSLDGMFACGDCRAKSLYQVISAASDGAVACDSAHKYLLNLE